MSNDSGFSVWVGDLDGYINIDTINYYNELEAREEQLAYELETIGEIKLLAGKAISAETLNRKGVTPDAWRHAVHVAQRAIGEEPAKTSHPPAGLEIHYPENCGARFLRAMMDLGRPYAVARYARWEQLDYPSATTSTLNHGIRALVNQFLASEGIERGPDADRLIREVLTLNVTKAAIAYHRAGCMQAALHRIADMAPGHPGARGLNKENTRALLSLTRLFFSTRELQVSSVSELRSLMAAYIRERELARADHTRQAERGHLIRNWRLRHLRPLTDLFPYAIRYGLSRAAAHPTADASLDLAPVDWELLVNELALAHCGMRMMRTAGRNRTRAR